MLCLLMLAVYGMSAQVRSFLFLLYHIFRVTEIYYAKIFLTEKIFRTEKKTAEAAFFVGR